MYDGYAISGDGLRQHVKVEYFVEGDGDREVAPLAERPVFGRPPLNGSQESCRWWMVSYVIRRGTPCYLLV